MLVILLAAGCSSPYLPGNSPPEQLKLVRLEGTRFIELREEFSAQIGKRKRSPVVRLPRGKYVAYFADNSGTYYEAPFSQIDAMYFSRGRRGGVYVMRTESGPRAYLYHQMNSPNYYYAQGVGMVTMGGGNGFTIGDELPVEFLNLLDLNQS